MTTQPDTCSSAITTADPSLPNHNTDPSSHQDNENGIRGEIALWRSVITQALMDASSNSKKDEAKNEKMQALRWLASNSRDFKMICYYAGYDPAYIRQKVSQALERNCCWRAPSPSYMKKAND